MAQSAAVYIHIPFCRSKCGYCDFASYASLDHLYTDYSSALIREITEASPLFAKTLFFGGGTPSLLPLEQTAAIVDAAKRRFSLKTSAEITMEANPATIDVGKLKALRAIGINRLSIGAQSFDDMTLKTLGRGYSASHAVESLENARQAGFENLSIDIMTGIPGQTMASLMRDLKMAVDFNAEHLSVYQLTLHENSPMSVSLRKSGGKLPDDGLQAEFFETAIEFLSGQGYLHYEVSNFARPGMECRHNMAYWLGDEYLGLGSGAHSFVNNRRRSNPDDPNSYIKFIATGTQPSLEAVTAQEELFNYLLMRLRLVNREVRFKEIGDRFQLNFLDKYRQTLEKLSATRLLTFSGNGFTVTRRGLLFLNDILLEFV